MRSFFLLFVLIVCFFNESYNQTITQTVRGVVYDLETNEPLSYATIIIPGSDPLIGAISGENGGFVLKNVIIGRTSFRVSMIGYDTSTVKEVMVTSGKEVNLRVGLKKSDNFLDEHVVKAKKDAPLNLMAAVSGRQFTVEETQRYAGGMNDPARLASAFAGVATTAVSSNGISVRGNNPYGLLWRVEGVEVPNPNHFANLTVIGGGMLTVISNQVMGNSDFYTGAFSSEYGNALSGVFDIKLRNGNNSKKENTFQAGIIGIDFSAEGPFSNSNDASYIVNYRYSTMGLIKSVLPDDVGVIEYQDLCFKANFPTKKAGTFSLWGIAALDGQEMNVDEIASWESDFDREDSETDLYLFATGIGHKLRLFDKIYLRSDLAVFGEGLTFKESRYDYDMNSTPWGDIKNKTWGYTLQTSINSLLSDRHVNKTGFKFTNYGYNIDVSRPLIEGGDNVSLIKNEGEAGLLNFYTQSRISLSSSIDVNIGFHSQYFLLNDNFSVEPRLSLKYKFNNNHSLALAYGLHSRTEMLQVYFVEKEGRRPNKDLDFFKSSHYVLSYNFSFSENLHMVIEPYFQKLKNVPVAPDSYLSTINLENDIYFNEEMISKGTGRNIGLDITIERFLKNGYYYLLTGSFFDSKYKAADGKERNTRFNKNYIVNALFGKEWLLGKYRNNILGVNLRMNFLGGNRKECIDMNASLESKEVIYKESENNIAFSDKFDDMPVFSFNISYRKNKPRYSYVFTLNILNAGGVKGYSGDYYNIRTGNIDTRRDGIIIPDLSFKIEF